MNKSTLVAVGLCAYKRPKLLRLCLESLSALNIPDNVDLIILVADNDPEGSSRETVKAFRGNNLQRVYYQIEKKRGIPFARNNILKQALELDVSVLAFIDDDETADPQWLNNLYSYYEESRCDVVRGFVKTVYSSECPAWIKKGDFYQRKNHKTGETFTSASTNNVLMNFKKICVDKELRFDNSIGLKGGSDSEFFNRVSQSGSIIIWKEDAVVYETLEKERFLLSYLLKRKFRTRNGKTYFKNISAGKWINTFIFSILKILKALLTIPLGLFSGYYVTVIALTRISEAAGRLLGLFHIHPGWNEYDRNN